MRRIRLIAALLLGLALPVLASAVSAPAAAARAEARPQLLALRGGGSHFGGSHFGGGGLRSNGRSIFGSSRSRRGLLRRIARILALSYIAHLFFSHGGLSILLWIVIIGLVVMVWRRRRRRRYAY